jgi:hypothetical protein
MTIVSTNPCTEKQPYAWSKCEDEPGRLAVGRRYGDGEKALVVQYGWTREQEPDQSRRILLRLKALVWCSFPIRGQGQARMLDSWARYESSCPLSWKDLYL